jgi:hypothetical protein
MPTHTIEFTDTEERAMNFAASSADDWIQKVVHERARVAFEEIVADEVRRLLAADLPIPPSKQAIFDGADLTKPVIPPANSIP